MSLRRLGFAGRFGGAAPDHGERQVGQAGHAEGEEQAVVVQALDKRGVREHAGKVGGGRCLQKAGDDRYHADEHGRYRAPVPAARVRVLAVHLVELGQVELPAAYDPVVHDHHRPDGPEEAAVADEPGKDVGADGLEDQPGKKNHADDGGDDAAGPERDIPGRQVREVERGRDHVRGHVRGYLGYRDNEHGEDEEKRDTAREPRDENDRVPDSFPEDHDGRRRDRDPDKRKGRHGERKPEGLPDNLGALGLRVAGEVRDVEGERYPVPHVRRQGREEQRPERGIALLELGRGREHVAHAAARNKTPDQERDAAAEKERCGERLEPLYALDAGQDDDELYRPEHDESYERVPGDARPAAPDRRDESVEGRPP